MLVVNKFLHHPLTDEQRALYQQLADNSQPYQFHGHSVIIASATLTEPVEEISTLAHKLHDLYEPDGLFMLVQMGEHIQLVARSTERRDRCRQDRPGLGRRGPQPRRGRADPRWLAGCGVRDAGLPAAEPHSAHRHRRPDHVLRRAADPGAGRHHCRRGRADAPLRVRGLSRWWTTVGCVGMLTRREIDRALHHGLERAPGQPLHAHR